MPRRRTRRRGSSRQRLAALLTQRPVVAFVVLVVAAALLFALVRSRERVTVVHGLPGSFTGYAFDACETPSQSAMDTWLTESPYWGVGFYVSGANRACTSQQNLDATWVATQAAKGWHLLPITVGRQAACARVKSWTKVDADPRSGYAAARAQGVDEAQDAVSAASGLGIGTRSVLWLDFEAFDTGNRTCRLSSLAFVAGWTQGLHRHHYRSGFYSSATSGIRVLDRARAAGAPASSLPDLVWFADWNGRADTRSRRLAARGWADHARVHQFLGNRSQTWGGVTLPIDADFMDTGHGSAPPGDPPGCRIRPGLVRYPALGAGDRGAAVSAVQCLLRRQGFGPVPADGAFGTRTAAAVRRFQEHHGRRVSGSVSRGDWTALAASGTTPLLKYGAASDAVRRVQRALDAAGAGQVPVTGVFGSRTTAAVKRYQRSAGLEASGVVTGDLWVLLQRGRVR